MSCTTLSQSVEPTWRKASEEPSSNSTSGQERLHHFSVLKVLPWSQKSNAKQVFCPKKLHRSTGVQLSFLYKVEEGPSHSIQMMTISVTASLFLSLLSETSVDFFPPWCMILHKYTALGSRPKMTLHPRHL